VTYSIEQTDGGETVTLEGELNVSCADELKEILINALSNGEHVKLDLQQVTEVDLSCLQLLCSAHRTSVRLNKIIGFTGTCPASLKDIAERSGYARHAGCPRDIHKNCIWAGI